MTAMDTPPAASAASVQSDDAWVVGPGFRGVALRSLAIFLLSAACALAVAVDWHSPLRTVLAIGFLLFAPGLALAELLEIREHLYRLTIATGTSLGIETVVALSLIYAHAWSIGLAVGILVGLTGSALVVAVLRARHRPVSSSRGSAHA